MSTIKDVAHAAGVSISTVSIVLNGLAEARKIPKRTQDKVLEAVHAVNYQPNLSARRLRSSENQEYTIAIYWANDTRIFVLTRIIQALQGMILRSSPKINLEIRPFVPGHLENDVALRTLSSFNGVMIGTLNKQDLDYLECRPPLMPVVLYNRRSKYFSSVSIDNFAVGKLAAEQLLDKGIREIGVVTQGSSFIAMGMRRSGFMETCLARGVAGLEKNTVVAEDTIAGGYAAGKEFLRRGKVPRGIFCEDDAMGLGVLNALWEAGYDVPGDVRVIATGMGSPDMSRYSVPPLTVVELPLGEMARGGVEQLIKLIERKCEVPQDIRFESVLYVRQSC